MKIRNNEAKSASNEVQCWTENPQAQMLKVELADGSFHLCPYSWLIWVRFVPKDRTDTVTLIYNSHTVSIIGENLRDLGLAFQQLRVESVRINPKSGAASVSNEFASIHSIRIEDQEKQVG